VFGMLQAIVQRPAIPPAATLILVAVTVVPLWLVQLVQYLSNDLDVVARAPWYVRSAFYTACFYAIVLGGEFGGEQFIYFQF
jgi:alginate O-acetyltransferase complex protein AlgI